MITSRSNVLVAALNGDILVSAGMAERAQLQLERDSMPINFVMYEVTEAATREEYRGQGLYTTVAQRLMEYLAESDVNLVYAESNLLASGVIKAAQRQGRHSVLETFEEYGFTPKPLRQHVRIYGGSSDTRPHEDKNDLLVTYMTREEVQNNYGRPTN